MTRKHLVYCARCSDSVRTCATPVTHRHVPELCRRCVVGGHSLTDDPSDVLIRTPFYWTTEDARAALAAGLEQAR